MYTGESQISAQRLVEPQPADLGSLRSRFAELVDRAHFLGHRAVDIADTVFGSRPEAVGNGASSERGPSTFAELVNDLEAALARIESNLNRL